MEEGSLRVDANVSVRAVGSDALGTRCEIKNLNSIRSLGRAIEYEAGRQAQLLADGERVAQQTRHWDEESGRTSMMRSKEEADDYRYFPEPDLVPVDLGADRVAEIAAALPLLPAARRHRLAAVADEPVTAEAVVVTVERGQDDQALAAMAWVSQLDPSADADRTGGTESGADIAGRFMTEIDTPAHVHPEDDAADAAPGSVRPCCWTVTDAGVDAAFGASDAAKSRVLVHVVQNLAVEGGPELAPVRLAELVSLEVAGDLTATQAKHCLLYTSPSPRDS